MTEQKLLKIAEIIVMESVVVTNDNKHSFIILQRPE